MITQALTGDGRVVQTLGSAPVAVAATWPHAGWNGEAAPSSTPPPAVPLVAFR